LLSVIATQLIQTKATVSFATFIIINRPTSATKTILKLSKYIFTIHTKNFYQFISRSLAYTDMVKA